MEAAARTRARWQGRESVERFAQENDVAQGRQHLKSVIESDIIRRFVSGERLLDVGIGTGRVSLPLVADGIKLTGVDSSSAMIERCSLDARSLGVRLLSGDIEQLPFAAGSFDTVISIDTFSHFPNWQANLDELFRVTNNGGRTIVDLGSRDHINAVALHRGLEQHDHTTMLTAIADEPVLRLSPEDLLAFAAEREVALVTIVPIGVVFGNLVPNHWMERSFADRSGGIDRLVSWFGADPLLFDFARFVERRIVQHCSPAISDRMFAVFDRERRVGNAQAPPITALPDCDERGRAAWFSELDAHMQHEPNRNFAITLLLACNVRLPDIARAFMPQSLLHDLARAEEANRLNELCAATVDAWSSDVEELIFHGVNLASAFKRTLHRELLEHLARHG